MVLSSCYGIKNSPHRVRPAISWMQNHFSEIICFTIMFSGKYSLDVSWFNGEKYEKKVTRANYKKFRFRPNTHRRRYNLKQNWNKLLLLSNFLEHAWSAYKQDHKQLTQCLPDVNTTMRAPFVITDEMGDFSASSHVWSMLKTLQGVKIEKLT